jgi:lipopolysaccharide/colanic/teichoic acid biosynthesis glycosyltransferase
MEPNRRVNGRSESSYKVSPWCNSAAKRAFDLLGAIFLLLLFLPLMLVVALAVRLTSRGPVLFRQRRPGKDGREFSILKFRTMLDSRQHHGPMLTRAADPRVTWLGRHMRRWKLDELPQLWNVVAGDMSFVGPRPQPTRLWQQLVIQEAASCVLSVRPGITSQATLNFRNEEELLAPLSSEEVEDVYMRAIMPLKLKMETDYLQSAGFISDLRIIFKTTLRVFKRTEDNDLLIKEYMPAMDQREVRRNSGSAEYVPAREEKEYLPIAEQAD